MVNITSESYNVFWMKGLECYFLLKTVMRDIYPLHDNNIGENMVEF
jgi:hypothetical protein